MVKVSHHGSEYSYSDKLYQLLQTNYYLLSTICNGQWIKGYGFSEDDARRYVSGKSPHIYQLRGKKIISPRLAVCGKFPDEDLSLTEG